MDLHYESHKTLERILTNISFTGWSQAKQKAFRHTLAQHFPVLFEHMVHLYGHHYDCHYHLHTLIENLARFHKGYQFPKGLTKDSLWYKSQNTVGLAVYVDLFAGDLEGLIEKVPYLETLGITYLHLMPLYKSPEGNSDGGYAVSDYRTVNPALGTNASLEKLAKKLHSKGIRLVLDFVFNHTADDHAWAQQALAGDQRYQQFYHLLDKHDADDYNQTVREIFPQVRRGSFTYNETLKKWVWTTFNSFQWDLNYANPDVFVSIVDEMLHLVSLGCDVLRLDALAFIWKEKGTVCENLPNAHRLIRAFNACLRIAAPHVHFKSEAIVHPDDVNKYIDLHECELSYNPLMMALMWESLATRETQLLNASLHRSFTIPSDTTWVNYIRCHDDIGWTWDDHLSNYLGINGQDHRRFLNQFYTGRFQGSFAKGVAFQENPSNGDCRVCGSLASLAGVEQALDLHSQHGLYHAVKRVRLLNAVNFSMPGIPLLYQGDELGVLNDYSYEQDPNKAEDARWVNRKPLTPADFELAQQSETPQGQIAAAIQQLIHIRRQYAVFGPSEFQLIATHNPHCFAFKRVTATETLLVIANFSEHDLAVELSINDHFSDQLVTDLLRQQPVTQRDYLALSAYDILWCYQSSVA